MLTTADITKLATGKGVRQIAVENFLSTLYPTMGKYEALANMAADARSYRWNAETQRAIRRGIVLFFNLPRGGR